jgi:hypothetical protein
MKEVLQNINDFFTSLFGSIGKWVMLGVFVVAIIFAIVLIIYAIVNIEKVIFYGLLILLIVALSFYVYNKYKNKG